MDPATCETSITSYRPSVIKNAASYCFVCSQLSFVVFYRTHCYISSRKKACFLVSEQWKNALTLAHIVCEVRSTHPQSRFEPQLSWTTNHGGRSTPQSFIQTFKGIDYRIRQNCRLPLFLCSPPVLNGNLPAESRCRHGISSFL